MQYVEVEFTKDGKRYTYSWSGPEKLKVGEKAIVPSFFNTRSMVTVVNEAAPEPSGEFEIRAVIDRS